MTTKALIMAMTHTCYDKMLKDEGSDGHGRYYQKDLKRLLITNALAAKKWGPEIDEETFEACDDWVIEKMTSYIKGRRSKVVSIISLTLLKGPDWPDVKKITEPFLMNVISKSLSPLDDPDLTCNPIAKSLISMCQNQSRSQRMVMLSSSLLRKSISS